MNKLEQAKELLEKTDATFCAITQSGETVSSLRGIAPIMNMLEKEPESLRQAYVADRVIGKAAAFLLIKGQASGVYAKIISCHALEVLGKSGMEVAYEKRVSYIVNRKGDGMCPMEECVLHTEDAKEAWRLLSEKYKSLTGQRT